MLVELNTIAKPKNIYLEYMSKEVFDSCIKTKFVGSRVTCSPAPTDTDLDILCLTKDLTDFIDVSMDWKMEEAYGLITSFLSFRKGEVNLIVTNDEKFYNAFEAACDLCKALNLMDKKQRIAVHDAFLEFEP